MTYLKVPAAFITQEITCSARMLARAAANISTRLANRKYKINHIPHAFPVIHPQETFTYFSTLQLLPEAMDGYLQFSVEDELAHEHVRIVLTALHT